MGFFQTTWLASKAWYGDYAVKENEYGYQWLPKLGGNESLTVTIERAKKGEVDGLLVLVKTLPLRTPIPVGGAPRFATLSGWLSVIYSKTKPLLSGMRTRMVLNPQKFKPKCFTSRQIPA